MKICRHFLKKGYQLYELILWGIYFKWDKTGEILFGAEALYSPVNLWRSWGRTGTKLLKKVLSIKNVLSYISTHDPKAYQNLTPLKWLKFGLNKCNLMIQHRVSNGVLPGSGDQLIVTRSVYINESLMFYRNFSYILYC